MLREQIQSSPEYQEVTAQQPETTQQAAQVETVGAALDPVLQWEKGDVEFWLQVVQLVVLLLILRELRKGGGI